MRLFLASYLSGKDQADINDDLADNFQCNDARLARIYAKKDPYSFTELDAARSRIGIQRLFARNQEKAFIKTHAAVAEFRGYPSFDVASTYASILILRNPLAVLPSFARHMSISINEAVVSMASSNTILGKTEDGTVPTLTSSWSKFTRSWIAARQQMNAVFVKYEDMKDDAYRAFSEVLAHIRIPVDEARVKKAIGATDFEQMKAQDLAAGFKERTRADKGAVFFRSGKTEGWRDELSEEQVVATIRNHWDVMEQLDYIPADLQTEFEQIKFDALEAMVAKGVDIGIYTEELNALRAKRGIRSKLQARSNKSQIKDKKKSSKAQRSRPALRKTFG